MLSSDQAHSDQSRCQNWRIKRNRNMKRYPLQNRSGGRSPTREQRSLDDITQTWDHDESQLLEARTQILSFFAIGHPIFTTRHVSLCNGVAPLARPATAPMFRSFTHCPRATCSSWRSESRGRRSWRSRRHVPGLCVCSSPRARGVGFRCLSEVPSYLAVFDILAGEDISGQ